MRRLKVVAAGAAPGLARFAEKGAGGDVYFRLPVLAGGEINMPVVEEQGGVDAFLGERDGVGPGSFRGGGGDEKIAIFDDVGGHHVKDAVMMTKRRRIDARGGGGPGEIELAAPGEAMPDGPPADKVAAVIKRDARKIFK
jgi:hypothetical protein